MEPNEREQAFLAEVYRRARVLEYDKLEAEKVARNKRRLAQRRNAKFAVVLLVAAAAALLIRYGKIDQSLCIGLSALLIGVGLILERTDYSWNSDRWK